MVKIHNKDNPRPSFRTAEGPVSNWIDDGWIEARSPTCAIVFNVRDIASVRVNGLGQRIEVALKNGRVLVLGGYEPDADAVSVYENIVECMMQETVDE